MSSLTEILFTMGFYQPTGVILITHERYLKENKNAHCDYQFMNKKVVGVEFEPDIVTIVRKNNDRHCEHKQMTKEQFLKEYFTEAL